MRPLLISSMRRFLFRGCFRRAADHQEEQRHANSQSVGDLIEHAGLRPIGDGGIDFEAANHGSGMQHQRIGFGAAQSLRRKLVLQNVFIERERRLVQALLLHAQCQNDVRIFERFGDARDAANRSRPPVPGIPVPAAATWRARRA